MLRPLREGAPGAREAAPGAPPVRTISIAPRFLKSRTAPFFEAEEKLAAHLATVELELVVYDLVAKKEQVLMTVPVDTAFNGVAWAPNDQHVSLVRWKFPDNSRGGGVPDDDAGILDALGWLRPVDNPFFTSNVLDLFRLHGREVQHVEIRPSLHPREVFVWASWSPEGRTLVAQVWHPAQLEEREYPTYANPDRSLYRFYSAEGWPFQTLSTPETSSIYSIGPFFFSPHEMVLVAPWRMGWAAHVYDLHTGHLRRLPIPEGAVHQGLATRATKELVFNFGSFQEPPEVYRVGWRSRAPIPVTTENASIKSLNQIRVDRVSFGLPGGRVREGRLIQPKGAAFPPRKVPIVVWQQGGPTGYMGNDWGGSVEQPFALLPNFGFAMVVVPLEGRVNLGPRLLNALADGTNFGQVDVDEGAEIAREMVKRGWTKHDRLGITGCSYGGYFTSQSITQHPDVYAAANTQCTLLDLVFESDYGYKSYITYLMGRTTTGDLPEIERDSPLYNALQVKTPTLIFAGLYDFLPYGFSGTFHDLINGVGTDADFYTFDYEGHGLGLPGSQFVAGEAQIYWFRKYLKMH
jgi:dipeptidyl aminopeptidase/acylaminoacyl peptidase